MILWRYPSSMNCPQPTTEPKASQQSKTLPGAQASSMTRDDQPNRCIVFDIGGTSVRAANYDPQTRTIGDILHHDTPNHHIMPGCSLDERSQHLYTAMEKLVDSLCGDTPPQSIGCAFPGPIDPDGNVLSVPTVFGGESTKPRPVGRELASRWPTAHIELLNDVTAAGYYYLNSPTESFCITTVSSGVGNKVFINGEPVVGPVGRGGEIGHVVVDPSPNAPPCDCGGHGHLGGIASGRGTLASVVRAAQSDPSGFKRSALYESVEGVIDSITNEHIAAAYRAEDQWVSSQMQCAAEPLARVLATIHSAIGIERFVMMGGFALALGGRYVTLLAELCQTNCWNLGQDWNQMLELGTAGDRAGLIGAGHAAMTHLERHQWK